MNETQTSDIADHALTEVLQNRPDSNAAAYKALINDFMAMGNSGVTDSDQSSIMRKLEDRNILPEIVVGYLKKNFSKLDENNDGQISLDELQDKKHHMDEPNWFDRARAVNKESIKFDFDNELLDELKTEPGLFKEIASASSAGDSPSSIEIVDLEIYSEQRSKQTAFRQDTIPLLKGGMHSWMARLDEKDGVYDGYASAEDIANFYKKKPKDGLSSVTAGIRKLAAGDLVGAMWETKFAEDLAGGKHQEFLRDGALDIVSIMRKAGLKPKVVNSEVDYVNIEDRLNRTLPGYPVWGSDRTKDRDDSATKQR